MTGRPYSLHIRETKSKEKIYYAQFRLPSGKWGTSKSTGQTVKKHAVDWCENYNKKHNLILPGQDITLQEFAKDFFNWNGPWATDKKVTGKRIGERHCLDRADIMRIYVLPTLGSQLLRDITKIKIKIFRNVLYDHGKSGSLINKCLYALKAVLEAAEERELIQATPKIERAAEKPKNKGILTVEEVKRLFSISWVSKASYSHPAKSQFMGYVGNLLAATTGLRISELQALLIQDINLTDSCIVVKRSWDHRLHRLNNSTKNGRERTIFIPSNVIALIDKLLEIHPSRYKPDSFLFWGDKKPEEKPAERMLFIKSLYNALECIGIDELERKKRNITFHSWRHWFNSLLINARIPIQKIQSLTGHLTNEMSQHYYHLDDMSDVKQIQESIFK